MAIVRLDSNVKVEIAEDGREYLIGSTYEGVDPVNPLSKVNEADASFKRVTAGLEEGKDYNVCTEKNPVHIVPREPYLMVLFAKYPWKWKFIHWWRGIDKFVQEDNNCTVEMRCTYYTLWETIKGVFNK